MNRKKLMETAGLTESDLPSCELEADALLDEAIMEVTDARNQLECEKAGLTQRTIDDHSWGYRTVKAIRHLQAKVTVLKKHRNFLVNERKTSEKRARKELRLKNLEEARKDREARLEKTRLKMETHLKAGQSEAEITLAAVRGFLKTIPEEDRQPFYDVMRAAQNEFRGNDGKGSVK